MPNDHAPTPEPQPSAPGEVNDQDLDTVAGGLVGSTDFYQPPGDDGITDGGCTPPFNPFPRPFTR